MTPPIMVVEKLYGNWSCAMSSWAAVHELLAHLQTAGPSALVVSNQDEFVANLYADGDQVAVNIWGPPGYEQYVGATLASVPPRSELHSIELERNEQFPEDGVWVLVPSELMHSADAAVDILRSLSEHATLPSTLVATS